MPSFTQFQVYTYQYCSLSTYGDFIAIPKQEDGVYYSKIKTNGNPLKGDN